jgi:hypothetical protein
VWDILCIILLSRFLTQACYNNLEGNLLRPKNMARLHVFPEEEVSISCIIIISFSVYLIKGLGHEIILVFLMPVNLYHYQHYVNAQIVLYSLSALLKRNLNTTFRKHLLFLKIVPKASSLHCRWSIFCSVRNM